VPLFRSKSSAAYKSPIQIHRYTSGVRKHRVEVELKATGAVLASCYIGDDEAMETIADLLSAKGLAREAMALRKLMTDARKVR
jgi:hypothetical protein